jgi:Transposase IS116/IS110/IS902 family
MGVAVQAIVTTLIGTQAAIGDLEAALAARFDNHPDAEILRSLPGLGVVLGGRVLGEFGEDPTRFTDAASRRRYAGTAPITRASGRSRVVLLRRARNQRLADACRWWAFNAIQHSDGAMAYYRRRRAAGEHPRGSPSTTRQQARRPTAPLPRTPRALPRRHRLAHQPADRGLNHRPDSRRTTGAQRRSQRLPRGRRAASRSALESAAKTRTIIGAGRCCVDTNPHPGLATQARGVS